MMMMMINKRMVARKEQNTELQIKLEDRSNI